MSGVIRMQLAALAAFVVLFAGCSKMSGSQEEPSVGGSQAALTGEESALAGDQGFDESVLMKAKAYASEIEPLEGYNEEGDPAVYPGVTFTVPSDDNATAALKVIRELGPEVRGQGYEVFLMEMNFGMQPDRVAVMKTDDRFEILRVMQTGGYNYDIMPKDVQERLHDWDGRFGIEIIGAGPDWAQMEFKGRPDDMEAFAKEVYEFCPDIVDQGTGSVEALAKEMSDTNTIFLWWD